MSVTIKNTKNEILEALDAAKTEIEKLKNIRFAPTETAREHENIKVVSAAIEDVNNNLFSDEINKKLLNVTNAIKLQSEKLKELYSIESELLDLTIVINSKKAATDRLNEDSLTEKARIQAEIDKLKEVFTEQKNILEKEYNELKSNLKLQRDREIEEYSYNLKRRREKDLDEWNDEKQMRELIIATKESEVTRTLDELDAKKKYMEELEVKVLEFPNKISESEDAAYKKGKSEAGKEYGYEKNLYMKEAEYKEREYKNKISRLEEDLGRERETNRIINEKLDKAYSEIRDLASKTVESTGGVKVIGGYNNEIRK